MSGQHSFTEHHLVLWVDTLRINKSTSLDYPDLCDGIFLNDVMHQIDASASCDGVIRPADDVNSRLHNWDILLNNIRAYYNEVLQQLILLRMPNVKAIVKDPDKEPQYGDVEMALLLILGCAVQSENKEFFIEKIKSLDVDTQHALVASIQEITDENTSVMSLTPPTHTDTAFIDRIYHLIHRLLSERDETAYEVAQLAQERDYYQSRVSAEGTNSPNSSTPMSVTPEKQHLAVELADTKAKLRRVRQELEDKMEVMSDLKDELEEHKQGVSKLRAENLELVQDARAARTYRDELDMIKEKVSKVDRYEAEVNRYKEQLNEMEFYKTRVEELREDNALLAESKGLLEEQLSGCQKRVEAVTELETAVRQYRQQNEALTKERELERQKLDSLTEEMARLEFDKKNSMNESATLEHELEEAKRRVSGLGGSLSSQIEESSNAKVLRLQLENQRLLQKISEFEETTSIDKNTANLELQKENQRLAKKVEDLQQTSSDCMNQLMESESKQKEADLEQRKISQSLEAVRDTSQRQITELEMENKHLNQTIQTLRERNEKTNDLRMKEVEKENKRLHDNVSLLTQKISTLGFENRQLQKAYDCLKESSDKISDLENENASLEKENGELHKEVAMLKMICDKCEKLEHENQRLDAECRKMSRANDLLNSAVAKKDDLEKIRIDLTVENERLKRALDVQKDTSSKSLVELESEKEDLCKQVDDFKKQLDSTKCDVARIEQLGADLLSIDCENKKLEKSLESTVKRLKQVERDNMDLEMENENLHKSVDSLKLSVKHLDVVEKEMADLEVEVSNLNRDKATYEKDNRKLKQSLEMKEVSLDDATFKLHSLDKEHKNLQKMVERSNSMNLRLRETEKENKELVQQVTVDKKTVATLRDDLFNEKLKNQQLTNDLDRLNHELERIGVSKEKLIMVQNTQDESRYKVLETMMEDALKKSTEIQENKISALESRLDESKKRNSKLQEDLHMVRHEYEALKERLEEETAGSAAKDGSRVRVVTHPVMGQMNATKDILQLKDHMVEVERANATLLAENKSFTNQIQSQHERIRQLETQAAGMQSQISAAQSRVNAIQSDNAKLQVENTTLQSQSAALASQNASLHGQLGNLESEHERLVGTHEELQTAHDSLSCDHDALQQLHEQLSSEYEALISEHGSLKSIHKSLKTEVNELRTQLSSFLDGRDDVNKVCEMLEQERDQLKLETKSLGNLQMDYNELRDNHDKLSKSHEKLATDYKILIGDHKNVKTEYNKLKLKHDEVQGDLDGNRANLHSTEIEIAKLVKRCEAVDEMNMKVEEDNRQLIYQVQTLLNQNHELLTQALNSKDHFAEEEKAYLEKLADLRRQKEKLEEKIMEQYKMGKWDSSPRKKGSFGATLVRKARGLMNKARSRSRPNLSTTDKDDSALESLHMDGTKTLPRKFEQHDARRNSAGNIRSNPNHSLKKGLAKSTTALNAASSDSNFSGTLASDILTNSPHSSPALSKGRPDHTGDADVNYRVVSPSPRSGAVSPLDEIVSLKQFLAESNRSPSSRRRILESSTLDANDSGSLDSSSQGASDTHANQPRCRLPPRPQSCMQLSSPPMNAPNDLNISISHLSHISTPSHSATSFNDSVSTPPLCDSLNFSNNNSGYRGDSSNRNTPSQRQSQERFQSPMGRVASPPVAPHQSATPHSSGKLSQPRRMQDVKNESRQNHMRPSSALPFHNRHTPIIDKSQMLAHQLRTKSPGIVHSHSVNSGHRPASSCDDDSSPLPSTEDQPFIPKPVPVYRDKNGAVIQIHERSHLAGDSRYDIPQDRSQSVQAQFYATDPVPYSQTFDVTPRSKSRAGDSRYSSTPISQSASRVIQRQYSSPNATSNTSTVYPGNMSRNDEQRMTSEPNATIPRNANVSRTSRVRSNESSRNLDSSRSDDSMSRSFEASRSLDFHSHTPQRQETQMSRVNHQMSKSSHQILRSDHQTSRLQQNMPRSEQQISSSDHQILRLEQDASRNVHQMSRSDHQMSRSDHQMSRSDHQMSRSDHQMSRTDHPMSRSDHQMGRSEQVARPSHQISRSHHHGSAHQVSSSDHHPSRMEHGKPSIMSPTNDPPRPKQRPQSAVIRPPTFPPPPPPRGPTDARSSDDRAASSLSNGPPDYPAPPRPTSRPALPSTPMARVLPQTKAAAPKPPAPKPDTCHGAPKETNSVWYEYGCV